MRLLALAAAALALSAACGGTKRAIPYDPHLRVAAVAPRSPAGWAPYPLVFPRSCWTRPPLGAGQPLRFAPTVLARRPATPARIAAQIVAGLDTSDVRGITFGPIPHHVAIRVKSYFAGQSPPRDALWAFVYAPRYARAPARPSRAEALADDRAQWEVDLAVGALRDRLCLAGGRPLAGWGIAGERSGIASDGGQALAQRFPNPSPDAFRRVLAQAAVRYGFRVVSLRLLRPLQLAPELVVETARDRTAFVRDLPALVDVLNPRRTDTHLTAETFEGFRLVARDTHGRPFVSVESASRGTAMGGEWSANPCVYPYAHSEPALATLHCGWPVDN